MRFREKEREGGVGTKGNDAKEGRIGQDRNSSVNPSIDPFFSVQTGQPPAE